MADVLRITSRISQAEAIMVPGTSVSVWDAMECANGVRRFGMTAAASLAARDRQVARPRHQLDELQSRHGYLVDLAS